MGELGSGGTGCHWDWWGRHRGIIEQAPHFEECVGMYVCDWVCWAIGGLHVSFRAW
jgi:hypothetical protein